MLFSGDKAREASAHEDLKIKSKTASVHQRYKVIWKQDDHMEEESRARGESRAGRECVRPQRTWSTLHPDHRPMTCKCWTLLMYHIWKNAKKKYPAVFINVLEETCLGAIYSTPSSTLKSMLRICPLVQPKPSPDYNWVASFPPKSYEE